MTAGPVTRVIAAVVLGHAAINLAHGLPHATVPVPLAPWQNAFVAVVVLVVPLAGLAFVRRGRVRLGGGAILAGGVASAIFGTFYHFVGATPDHVASVTGPWSAPFLLTAAGSSILAVATAVVGAWVLAASS